MNTKNNIDSEFVKRLIDEGLVYFFIGSQISSDNILERASIEDRLEIIKSTKNAIMNTSVENKSKYLDLLSDCENVLMNDLNELS